MPRDRKLLAAVLIDLSGRTETILIDHGLGDEHVSCTFRRPGGRERSKRDRVERGKS